MADSAVDIKKLLEAGAHFGHKTSRWHPKMGQYIHSKKGGSHIIDLTKTVKGLEEAMKFIEATVASGKQVLWVGTKRQAKDIIKKSAEESNMPLVVERWPGGLLTNKTTISSRVKRLKDLESRMESGQLAAKYNKLELQRHQEEIDEMNFLYGGMKDMNGMPGAVIAIDVNHEVNAIKEAQKLGIKVVALVDTNADPSQIDYVIPGNDDAIKTIQLIADYLSQAIASGKSKVKPEAPVNDKDSDTKEEVKAVKRGG